MLISVYWQVKMPITYFVVQLLEKEQAGKHHVQDDRMFAKKSAYAYICRKGKNHKYAGAGSRM